MMRLQMGPGHGIIYPMTKRQRKQFRDIFCAIALVLGTVLAIVIYSFGINAPSHPNTTFVVARGATVTGVANQLHKNKLIMSKSTFKNAVRAHGGKIQSGQYEIPRGASSWRIAKMLARGEIATVSVTLPEGLTIKQIKNQLLENASLTGSTECVSGRVGPICDLRDGDVFPDTYRVAVGTSRLAVLELAYKKMQKIKENWQRTGRRAPRPLKTWNDVVTLASIVQRETPRASEMPIVASVYINRLNQNMRLQADPTVVYALTNGLGDMRGAPLLRGHLKIESPYNTYINRGLPPAPIANVGAAAIRAVLQPADTNYLFFVADGRGGHRFTKSYEEHKKNHDDWRAIKKIRNKK